MFKITSLIFGAAAAKGVSKGKGTNYEYGILLQPVPILSWKNENGQGVSSGFKTPDNNDALKCTMDMLHSLDSIELPAFLEMDMQPSPDDIKELICVGFKVVAHIPTKYEEFQVLYNKKLDSVTDSKK
ncbi:hypothetical protein [Shewanella marina]|uniref:hypothetical protein n=1 Tax=Shewanella marina TaxID=487319 RepID=UPI00046F8739|nr:hypothetical protein [Shewanella marina]